jgi:hypothetical protein
MGPPMGVGGRQNCRPDSSQDFRNEYFRDDGFSGRPELNVRLWGSHAGFADDTIQASQPVHRAAAATFPVVMQMPIRDRRRALDQER